MVTVSTGGNILINVGPTQNGLIQPIFVERLKDMGHWLNNNGDAIYESRPWTAQNDTHTPNVWYTSKFAAADRVLVYAMVLEYPYDTGFVKLYSLAGKTDNQTKIKLLGYPNDVKVRHPTCILFYLTVPTKCRVFNV